MWKYGQNVRLLFVLSVQRGQGDVLAKCAIRLIVLFSANYSLTMDDLEDSWLTRDPMDDQFCDSCDAKTPEPRDDGARWCALCSGELEQVKQAHNFCASCVDKIADAGYRLEPEWVHLGGSAWVRAHMWKK